MQGLVFRIQSMLAMFNFASVIAVFSSFENVFPRANTIIERTDLMERAYLAWQNQKSTG